MKLYEIVTKRGQHVGFYEAESAIDALEDARIDWMHIAAKAIFIRKVD